MTSKLSHEVAEDQVNVLFDYYEIETPENSDMAEAFDIARASLLKHIRNGRIEILLDDNQDLKIKQHLKKPQGDVAVFEYGEINGRAKVQMKDKDSTHKKVYSLMASLSGNVPSTIIALRGVDLSAAEALGLILLNV